MADTQPQLVQRTLYGEGLKSTNAINKFPNIRDIAIRMALDNGAINRDNTVEEFLDICDSVLASCDDADLDALEMWLDLFTEEQADILADGEDTDIQELLKSCPTVGGDAEAPPIAKLFDDIFEAM